MRTSVIVTSRPTFDIDTRYDLSEGDFVCPFDGSIMEFAGGLFAEADTFEAAQVERIECPCCHHSIDANYPAYALKNTSRMSREYVYRLAAARRVDEAYDAVYAAIEAVELAAWYQQAAEWEAYINAQQAEMVAEWLANEALAEALSAAAMIANSIKRAATKPTMIFMPECAR